LARVAAAGERSAGERSANEPGAGESGAVADGPGAGPVLAAEELSGGRLRGASLTVRAGEIVGVAGLLGSGAEDLPYALFGGLPGARGRLRIADWACDAGALTPPQASR